MQRSAFSVLILICIFQLSSIAQQAGNLDSSFGNMGIAQTDPSLSGFENHLNKLLVLPDDKFIAVGYWRANSSVEYANLIMVRYHGNGLIDSSFGNNGIVELNISVEQDWKADFVRSAILQQDGKIVCVGQTDIADHLYSMFLCRFLPNGELDSGFGNNGIVVFGPNNGNPNEGVSVAEQSDGKLVVAVNNYGAESSFIMRYNSNGTPDQTFGSNGRTLVPGTGKLVIKQSDAIYISTGHNLTPYGIWNFAVIKLNANGDFDTSFGESGVSHFNCLNILDSTFSLNRADVIEVQPDGKILVGGGCENTSNGDEFFALGRLHPDGTLDESFGTDGRMFADLPGNSNWESIRDLLVQPDGKIIAIASAGNYFDYTIVRLNSDGSFDNSFGIDGVSIFDISGDQDYPLTAAFQSTGKLLVGGMSRIDSNYDFVVIRILTDINIGIVEFFENLSNTLVYPNPIEEQTRLQFELAQSEELTIMLLDMQGRLVKTFVREQEMKQGKHHLQLQFSNSLESGTYLLSISSEKGQMGVRIIKR